MSDELRRWIVATFLPTSEAQTHALVRAIDELMTIGRTSWPSVSLDPPSLIERVAALVAGADDTADAVTKLHADIVLVDAVMRGDNDAVRALDALVRQAADRAATRDAAPEEIAQRALEALVVGSDAAEPKLAQFGARGPLGAWLRVLVTRTGLNLQRSETARTRKLDGDDALVNAPSLATSPELQILRQRYAQPFRDSFSAALKELDPAERNMLRMHLVDGLGIDELAPLYAVHRATAARRLVRAKEKVLARTRELLQQALGIGDSEFSSLMALMLSQVEISSSFLGSEGSSK